MKQNRVWAAQLRGCLLSACLGLLVVTGLGSRDVIAAESRLLLTVHGSNTVGAKLMKNMLQAYFADVGATEIGVKNLPVENEYQVQALLNGERVHVNVAAHGSSTSFEGLKAGIADMGMSSRRIKDQEVEQLQFLGDMRSPTAEYVIAIDGLAVIVHKRNQVDHLSLDQLAGIFSGQITNWAEVGGLPGEIALHARDENSGTWDTFKDLVLRGKVTLAGTAARYESNDALSDMVASDPQAIGFVGLASVRDSKALGIFDKGTRPLVPNQLTVATEDYPLSRRLYVYVAAENSSTTLRSFIDFMQTDSAQQQADRIGYISQQITAVPASAVREGPAPYLQLTEGFARLSVNFRFEQGRAILDNKAQQDVRRLSAYLLAPQQQGKHVELIGFGDAAQNENRALVLSKLRAVAILSALRREGVGNISIAGFGSHNPVVANSGGDSIKNRRVEVWIR